MNLQSTTTNLNFAFGQSKPFAPSVQLANVSLNRPRSENKISPDGDLHAENRERHSNREKLSPATAYPSRAAEIYTPGRYSAEDSPRGLKNPLCPPPPTPSPSHPSAAGTLRTAASRVAQETARSLGPSRNKNILSEFNCGQGALDIHTLRVRRRVRQCVRPAAPSTCVSCSPRGNKSPSG